MRYRKTVHGLLAFLVLLFSLPAPPQAEGASDTPAYSLNLGGRGYERNPGLPFPVISKKNEKISVPVVVPGVEGKTRIEGNIQVLYLKAESLEAGFNTALNSNIPTGFDYPNDRGVKVPSEFVRDALSAYFQAFSTDPAVIREKGGAKGEGAGDTLYGYDSIRQRIGKVTAPSPYYLAVSLSSDGNVRNLYVRGGDQGEKPTVKLQSYVVNNEEPRTSTVTVSLIFVVDIPYTRENVAENRVEPYLNFFTNPVLEGVGASAQNGLVNVSPDTTEFIGDLDTVLPNDMLYVSILGDYNFPTRWEDQYQWNWKVHGEERRNVLVPRLRMPVVVYGVYISTADILGAAAGPGMAAPRVEATKEEKVLLTMAHNQKPIPFEVSPAPDGRKDEYLLLVPFLNPGNFYRDYTNAWQYGPPYGPALQEKLRKAFVAAVFGENENQGMRKVVRSAIEYYAKFDEQKLLGQGYSPEEARKLTELKKQGVLSSTDLIASRLAYAAVDEILKQMAERYKNYKGDEVRYASGIRAYLTSDAPLPKDDTIQKEILNIAREYLQKKSIIDGGPSVWRDPYTGKRYPNDGSSSTLELKKRLYQRLQADYEAKIRAAYFKGLTVDDIVDAYFSPGWRNVRAVPFRIKPADALGVLTLDLGIRPTVKSDDEAKSIVESAKQPEYQFKKDLATGFFVPRPDGGADVYHDIPSGKKASMGVPGKKYRTTFVLESAAEYPITNFMVRYYLVGTETGKIYDADNLFYVFTNEYTFPGGKTIRVDAEFDVNRALLNGANDKMKKLPATRFDVLEPQSVIPFSFEWTYPDTEEPLYLLITAASVAEFKNGQWTIRSEFLRYRSDEYRANDPNVGSSFVLLTPNRVVPKYVSPRPGGTKDGDYFVIYNAFPLETYPKKLQDIPPETRTKPPETIPPEGLVPEQPFRYETEEPVTYEEPYYEWVEDGEWVDYPEKTLPFERTIWLISFLLSGDRAEASGDGACTTATLKNAEGRTWTVSGCWDELEGRRIFRPAEGDPMYGKIWVDRSRYEKKALKQTRMQATVKEGTIKTVGYELRQKEKGDPNVVLRFTNPNDFPVEFMYELRFKNPDPEFGSDVFETREEKIVLPAYGSMEKTFDSGLRNRGILKYDLVIRTTKNLHPRVISGYEKPVGLGLAKIDQPFYIDFYEPEVVLEPKNLNDPDTFGLEWKVTNRNKIPFPARIEVTDANGKRTLKDGTMEPGKTESGFFPGVPSYTAPSSTTTVSAVFTPQRGSPMQGSASFTFRPADPTVNINGVYATYEVRKRYESVPCGGGTSTAEYTLYGFEYEVYLRIVNNANFPIRVQYDTGGAAQTIRLPAYGTSDDVTISGRNPDEQEKRIVTRLRWPDKPYETTNTFTVPAAFWMLTYYPYCW